MVRPYRILPASTERDIADVRLLFRAYAASLDIDLGYQGFQSEVEALPACYARPQGALFLARDTGGTAIGCVGVRPLNDPETCEMKRLYAMPEVRGLGVGRSLAEAAIIAARAAGYRHMLLDTLKSMEGAIALYEHLGFREIPPYFGPTPAETCFFRLALT